MQYTGHIVLLLTSGSFERISCGTKTQRCELVSSDETQTKTVVIIVIIITIVIIIITVILITIVIIIITVILIIIFCLYIHCSVSIHHLHIVSVLFDLGNVH